ncbi:RND family transporter [Pseudomonas sp. NPDC090208]|uniref:efflux RND transporter permease subunit n=1 Tax=Pseudomonas sp. NPDC090208 TaxID=3364478 RepID=UPI0038157409
MDHCNASTPVMGRLDQFDRNSGSFVERLFFNNRVAVLAVCLLITLVLGAQATRLQLNADFEKMIPTGHPYIAEYLKHKGDLKGFGNAVRIAVEARGGNILTAEYLETLKKLNDEVFLLSGVDRSYMKSLWTANMRWLGVTEDGLDGGPVIPDDYDQSPRSFDQIRTNLERSGDADQFVASDYKSSIIFVPLLDIDPATGKALDYKQFSEQLEALRDKYREQGVDLHITGFAKVVGDLIDGVRQVLLFFVFTIVIAGAAVYGYTRCIRSTLLVVATSLVAVVWQMGILPLLGFELDPYSILVPFLVFAIGISHGAQKMNGIMQDVGRGMHKLIAARFTFRRLFLAGLTALLCDAVGFAVLLVINIRVIQELAITASIGVAVLIFTNLILLPVLLSFTGVSPRAAVRSMKDEAADAAGGEKHVVWRFLDLFTERKWASIAVLVSLVLGIAGFMVSLHLKVGDLDPGAPELRSDSRYNLDNAFMASAYSASSDVMVVMIETPNDQCTSYKTQALVDALEWRMRDVKGVEGTNSLPLLSRRIIVGMNEGNPKWYELVPNQWSLNTVANRTPREIFNQGCNLMSLFLYLEDHKADTLERVVQNVEAFAAENNGDGVKFLLTAGNAGIEAATNIVVKKASHEMLFWVYGAVILLCFISFRSWRAVVCAVVPLVLTSILAEALMVSLGMGVKVATLPVIALGVGIGVDYALYVLTIVLAQLRRGASLSEAYYRALIFTGKVVMLTGVTLALGVASWAFSPIKFQADMGILLAFMFIWNMLGALILLPALAYFLLRPKAAKGARDETEISLDEARVVRRKAHGCTPYQPRQAAGRTVVQ